jgi:hypothetical protein
MGLGPGGLAEGEAPIRSVITTFGQVAWGKGGEEIYFSTSRVEGKRKMNRYLGLMVVGSVTFGVAWPAIASEAWTCVTAVGAKEFPNSTITYTVNGEMLTPSTGSFRPKILLNDDHFLIAFWIFKVDGRRRAKNIGVVEVDEPDVIYLVFDKARNRLLTLDAMHIALFSDETRVGSAPIEYSPALQSERCVRNQ